MRLALALALTVTACGYRPLNASAADTQPLAVVIVTSKVTPQSAADEVATGVRESLAEAGALRGGDGYPRVEIEVVRIDQESESIADATGSGPVGQRSPRARALRLGVVARAWVARRAGEAPTLDTGDVRAFSVLAAETEPGGAAELLFERAAREAGRRAGDRLGARILGHPAASE